MNTTGRIERELLDLGKQARALLGLVVGWHEDEHFPLSTTAAVEHEIGRSKRKRLRRSGVARRVSSDRQTRYAGAYSLKPLTASSWNIRTSRAELPEVLADVRQLGEHVVGDRDDVAADRAGVEHVEQLARAAKISSERGNRWTSALRSAMWATDPAVVGDPAGETREYACTARVMGRRRRDMVEREHRGDVELDAARPDRVRISCRSARRRVLRTGTVT